MKNRSPIPALFVLLIVGAAAAWWWLSETAERGDPSAILGRRQTATAVDPGVEAPSAGPGSVQPLDATGAQAPTRTATGSLDESTERATVTGIVTYLDDTPVPEVEVALYNVSGEDLDWAFTDDDGRFTLSATDPLLAGWGVATEAPFFGIDDDPAAVAPAAYVHPKSHRPDQDPVEVKLVLAPSPIIEGWVMDAQTGQPLELSEIYLLSTASSWAEEYQEIWPDEDGSFRAAVVDIPSTGLVVLCVDDEHRADAIGPLNLAPGEVRTLDFRLGGVRTLQGVVLDARSAEPVQEAEVMLLPAHAFLLEDDSWDTTWDDGTWELEVYATPDAYLRVFVRAEGYLPSVVRPTDPDRPIEVQLSPALTIHGMVKDGFTGEGIGAATVTATLASPLGALLADFSDSLETEADGSFSLLLEHTVPESAHLLVHAAGYIPMRKPLAELAPAQADNQSWTATVELDPVP